MCVSWWRISLLHYLWWEGVNEDSQLLLGMEQKHLFNQLEMFGFDMLIFSLERFDLLARLYDGQYDNTT